MFNDAYSALTGRTVSAKDLPMLLRLGDLTGSEKQVTWAEKIRANKVADILTTTAEMSNARIYENGALLTSMVKQISGVPFVVKLLEQPEARFWIDNRDENAKLLVAKSAKGII